MSNPFNIKLKVSGSSPVDATTDFTTDDQEILYEHTWAFSMWQQGLTTNSGTYTVEVHNGDGKWKTYKEDSTNVTVVDGLDDPRIPWTHFRIVYTANGETSGTVAPTLTMKP